MKTKQYLQYENLHTIRGIFIYNSIKIKMNSEKPETAFIVFHSNLAMKPKALEELNVKNF